MSLILSFDIGYASIGWCVLSSSDKKADPEFLGTGVVTFPTDDCLASTRRNLRRTRRHIRSTRQRIERMKRWLVHRGVLSRADLDKPGHPAPFLLAAAALQEHRKLNAWELWTVLRWYAHNRGYDGNSRWSREEASDDDTAKEAAAKALMAKYETKSMAETVCACLKLDPSVVKRPRKEQTISSHLPYKTLNAAYPRATVQNEVLTLLNSHVGKIPGLDDKTLDLLFTPETLSDEDRDLLSAADIKLPKRYHGGLLFGQLVPRFDNRIISRCPITWARAYDLVSEGLLQGGGNAGDKWHEFVVYASAEDSLVDLKKSHASWEKMEQAFARLIASGMAEKEAVVQIASKTADKFAKVPAAKSKEFLEYRFARVLANLRSDGKPLAPDLRQQLFSQAKERGRFTASELGKEIESRLGKVETNLEAYFNIAPEAEKQLVLDPAKALALSNRTVKSIWPHLGDKGRKKALETWRAGKGICPDDLLQISDDGGDRKAAETALKAHFDKLPKKEAKDTTWHGFLKKPIKATYDSGRATYARPVLRQVVTEVMDGFDPARSAADDEDANGRKKKKDGILYDLGIPTSRVRQLQNERPLDQLTNNHLVRHRMLILGGDPETRTKDGKAKRLTVKPQRGLIDDLIDEFAEGDSKQVDQVAIEVARELKEFSGKDVQEIKKAMSRKLFQHTAAVKRLEEEGMLPTPKRIKKCRIALDLDWTCPFTHRRFGPSELDSLELEHIIPRSKRLSDSLAGLVLTRKEINSQKANRTGLQFILESANDMSIVSEATYRAWVGKLKVSKKEDYPDDYARQSARKRLLLLEKYEDKERSFTPGQLTQSSQLMKLASGIISRKCPDAVIDSVPGLITSETRKSWDIYATLGHPDVCGDEVMRWVALEDTDTKGPLRNETGTAFQKIEAKERKSKGVAKAKLPNLAFWCEDDGCDAALQPVSASQTQGYCPNCFRVHRKTVKPKDEIRDLTHLHHAVDAATLALAAFYFPFRKYGKDQKGLVWQALAKRNRTDEEKKLLLSTGCFKAFQRKHPNGPTQNNLRLIDLKPEVKNALARSLAESRVVQHIPADRSGTKAELLTWGIVAIVGEKALIIQRPNRGLLELDPKSRQRRWKDKPLNDATLKLLREHGHLLAAKERRLVERGIYKLTTEKLTRLLGPASPESGGKLAAISGALVVEANFGLAIEPSPEVISFHNVHERLKELRDANGGKPVRVLRNGMLFRVMSGAYAGIWMLRSIADGSKGIKVRITRPHYIPDKTTAVKWAKDNVVFETLRKSGIEILPKNYTGHPLKD